MMYVLAAAVIAAASFLFAMLGLGGGMVYVPILHWMGFDLKTVAIPLGLLLNGLNTLLALTVYARKGLVDWRGGAAMGIAATVGAPLGAFVQPMVPKDYLLVFFAVAVVVAAARMVLTAFRSQTRVHELATPSTRLAVGIGGGGAIGFVGGLLGIGGGFLVGPILVGVGVPGEAGRGDNCTGRHVLVDIRVRGLRRSGAIPVAADRARRCGSAARLATGRALHDRQGKGRLDHSNLCSGPCRHSGQAGVGGRGAILNSGEDAARIGPEHSEEPLWFMAAPVASSELRLRRRT